MDRGRLRFALALVLFAGWVAALGTMAWFSADRPRSRVSTPIAR